MPLQGVALAPEVWERDVLPRRVGAYSPAWMDQSARAARWCGSAPGGRAQLRQGGALLPRGRALARPASVQGRAAAGPVHDAIRERLERGAAFWTDLLADVSEAGGVTVEPLSSRRRCGISPGPAR